MVMHKPSMQCGFWKHPGLRCGDRAVLILGLGGGSLPFCTTHGGYVLSGLNDAQMQIIGVREL